MRGRDGRRGREGALFAAVAALWALAASLCGCQPSGLPPADEEFTARALEKAGWAIDWGLAPDGQTVVYADSGDAPVLSHLKALTRLRNLETLELWGVDITAPRFAELRGLDHLTGLRLGCGEVTPRGLQVVGNLRGLQRLGIEATNVERAALSELAPLTSLAEMHLSVTNTSPVSLKGIGTLRNLRELRLTVCCGGVGDGFEEIGRLRRLESMSLSGPMPLGGPLAKVLNGLPRLKDLVIYSFRLSPTGLGGVRHCPLLESLELSGSFIGKAHLRQLQVAARLRFLGLSYTGVTDAALEELTPMKTLATLNLSQNGITDASMKHLRKVASLRALNLSMTKVTDAGLRELTALGNLRVLAISQVNTVTDAGVTDLRAALPKLRVVR